MDLATRRFVDLANYIGDAVGKSYGWKTVVAERLGITPSYLTRILNGNRGISTEIISRATKHAGIRAAYFSTGEPDAYVDPRGYFAKDAPPLEVRDLGDLVADDLLGTSGIEARAAALEPNLGSEGWKGILASVYESMSHAMRHRSHRIEAQNIAHIVRLHESFRIFRAVEELEASARDPDASDEDIFAKMRWVAEIAAECAAREASMRAESKDSA